MSSVNHETMIDTLSRCKILLHNGFNLIRAKRELLIEFTKVLRAVVEAKSYFYGRNRHGLYFFLDEGSLCGVHDAMPCRVATSGYPTCLSFEEEDRVQVITSKTDEKMHFSLSKDHERVIDSQ